MRLAGKLAYSSGALAMALSSQAFAAYILFFYVDVVKLPSYLAAIGMLIFGIWNAINDPLVGFISDHTRSRWGRRIPYIALGAIPFGFVYFLVWNPPFDAYSNVSFLFLYFVLIICLFDGLYTMTMLNWSSLYPEMFSSLKERSQVNAIRQTFAMIGLALGVAVPPLIYGAMGWGKMGQIFGIVIVVSLLVSLLGSREHIEYSQEKQLSLWDSIGNTFKNRSFLTFAVSNLFVQYSFVMILASVPFFAKYILDVKTTQTAAILAMAFLPAIPMLYVWKALAVRVGAKRCFMTAIVLMIFSLIPLFFVSTFGDTLIVAAFIGFSIAGFILAADVILSDVVDADEVHTNTRREGMYFGFHTFITRLAIGLEALSIGFIFSKTGYNPYVYTQTSEFLAGLRILIAGLPITALVLAFLIISLYPLVGKDKMKAMQAKLKVVHIKKGVE